MTTATSTVKVTNWDEERIEEAAETAVARVRFDPEWSGDLVGRSTSLLLVAYTEGDPEQPGTLVGPHVGYEFVRGTLAGRTGTFVLSTTGAHDASAARTDVSIVAGSGTGELAGITGTGGYTATGMEYTLELDYQL